MTHVIDHQDGAHLTCMWLDCEKPGHEEIKAVVREPLRTIHFVFCSYRHRAYWTNSHRNHMNLAPGDKGLLS